MSGHHFEASQDSALFAPLIVSLDSYHSWFERLKLVLKATTNPIIQSSSRDWCL